LPVRVHRRTAAALVARHSKETIDAEANAARAITDNIWSTGGSRWERASGSSPPDDNRRSLEPADHDARSEPAVFQVQARFLLSVVAVP
jgi:hypothetical protein